MQFILDVDVHQANHSDSNDQEPIQARLIENNFTPDQQYCDAGFVNGRTIMNSQKNGIAFEGPTAGNSQFFEHYNNKDRPFDAGDFKINIDPDAQTLVIESCPLDQIPIDQHRSIKTEEMLVHFDPHICRACEHARPMSC